MDIVYLNGEYVDKSNATVSVFDRGFLFGDSVYEVIPVEDGIMIGANPHLGRLNESLQSIGMDAVMPHDEWLSVFAQLQQRNQLEAQSFCLYLQVSRGNPGFRQHAIPHDCTPTVVVFCMPLKAREPGKTYKAITRQDRRHDLCAIKSTNLLANVLHYEHARQEGAIEAILHRDNIIVECGSANVFCATNGQISTPALKPYMLAGITRDFTIQTIHMLKLPFEERDISLDELKQADEIWLTSSSKQVAPITTLDNTPVGSGQIGSITQQLQQNFVTN